MCVCQCVYVNVCVLCVVTLCVGRSVHLCADCICFRIHHTHTTLVTHTVVVSFTYHPQKHRPPDKIKEIVGLSSKRCIPCEGGDEPKLSEHDIERLKKQVPGWKLAVDRTGVQCIRCQWTVRNFAAGLELFGRIGEVAEQQGHHPGVFVCRERGLLLCGDGVLIWYLLCMGIHCVHM